MLTNTTVDKLIELNLPPSTVVTLSYEDGTDCFVYNESEVDTALAETDVVNEFAEMVTNLGCNFNDYWGNDVLSSMVENEWFDEEFLAAVRDDDNDEEDSFTLQEAISEYINDNFYDQELIEKEVERYDHKRGYITLTTTLKTTVGDIVENNVYCTGWNVTVPLHGGTFTIET